jgi:hypothetical protein
MTANLFYALRCGVFVIHWMLFIAYGLLQFVSKPGSRLIVPALAVAFSIYCRLPLERLMLWYLRRVDWQQMPVTFGTMLLLCLVLAIAVCVALCAFYGVLRLFVLVVLALAVLQYTHWQGFDIAAHLNILDAMLALALVLTSCIYVVLSHLLILLLGVFPPAARPLRPLRTLKVKNRAVRPVVVRMAVPELPRRRGTPRVETLLPGAVK